MDCGVKGILNQEFTHVANSGLRLLSDELYIQTELSLWTAI